MQMTLCYATCVGKAANCIYPNKVVVDKAADMESAVAVDHACATYTGNRRGNSNFIESDVIPMDIDNDHSDNLADWITEDKMEELFGDVDYALVPSRHHMLAKDGKSERPRYHAYFPIEKCTDAAQYTAMKTAIQAIPEMIEIAISKSFQDNKKYKHSRHAKNGWYRYDTRFALPVYDGNGNIERYNVFCARLLIRHAASGKMYLYDVLGIKKETSKSCQE